MTDYEILTQAAVILHSQGLHNAAEVNERAAERVKRNAEQAHAVLADIVAEQTN